MKTLDELIREAAQRGNLTHLSVYADPSGKRWRASYAPAKTRPISFAEHDDPVVALVEAIRHASARQSSIPAVRREADLRAGVKHDPIDEWG